MASKVREHRIVRQMSFLPSRPPVDIEFIDLTYTVPQGRSGSKIILRGVSGLFRSGQLTAILGPSGAGKSTLLNILAGYRCSEISGSIFTNGTPRDLRQFRKLSRYIMQEDLIQPHISVFEAMEFSANLKLGTTMTRSQKHAIIDEILEMLRLTKTKNTQTLRLSGGEKKRLVIALELVNNPPVIFLDEPTTGLDDLSCSQCIQLLKRIADRGCTVICSIHTPSAKLFAMFDHVYIVAQGQCVFQGSGDQIVPFMRTIGLNCPKHYNPADFVIEVSSGEYGDYIEKMVAAVDNGSCYNWSEESSSHNLEEDELNQSVTTPLQTSKDQYNFSSSGWLQFCILTRRMMLQSWRDFSYLLLKAVMHVFIALMVGGIFFQFGHDASKTIFNFGFCYTAIIVFLYIPMMPILLSFPTEVQLMKREYFNRWYGLNAYYAALTVSKLPSFILFGTVYCVIVYVMTDQPLELYRMALFILICLLVGVVSESLGLVISSVLGVVNGMFVGPSLSVPLMLLAVYGIGFRSAQIPILIKVAMYFSYLRYGLEGVTLAIYGFDRTKMICPKDEVFCELSHPKVLLKETGMENISIWFDIGGLVMNFIVLRVLCYFLLRWRLSSYKTFGALTIIKRFVKRYFNFAQS